jgi:DNA-binding MarR family transcriptional regulator
MSRTSPDGYLTEAEFRAWGGSLLFVTRTTRALDEALTNAHGISVKEFDVLITLFNAPDGRLRMSELADRVVLSASGVTQLVTRLERDGLVQRIVDESDRRSFFATLTAAGHQRLRDSRPTHNAVIREHLTDRLSATHMKTMGALWETVLGDFSSPPQGA